MVEELQTVVQEASVDVWASNALRLRGQIALSQGEIASAISLGQQAVAQALTDLHRLGAIHALAESEIVADMTEQARSHAEDLAKRSQPAGMPYYLVRAQVVLARLARLDSDPFGAETLAHQALMGALAISAKTRITDALEVLAGVAADLGSHQEAARLFGAASAARDITGYARCVSERDADLDALGEALGEDGFQAASTKAQPCRSWKLSPTPNEAGANENARTPDGPASPQPRSESPSWSKTGCPTPTSAAGCCARPAPCKPI